MRECWNRQTGTFEVRVFRRVGSSPISRTSRKSLESKDSKLFPFYWFYNKCWGRGKPDPTLLLWLSPNSLIKAALIKAPTMSSIRLSNHLDRAAGFCLRRFFAIFLCIWPQSAMVQGPHALLPHGCGHYSPASLAANCAARSAFSGFINTLL